MVHPIFTTDLILEKIFSFSDLATSKEMKLISSSFTNNFKGCQENFYLKFKHATQIDLEVENELIFKWALKPENARFLKKMKIPIEEGLRSCVTQKFLEFHGHETTHLELFRQKFKKRHMDPDYRPVLCIPDATLIYNLLSKWCPNLEHLLILDNSNDNSQFTRMSDIHIAETKLKTLEIIAYRLNFPVYLSRPYGFPILRDLQESGSRLISNSPKLKELKISYLEGCLPFYLNRNFTFNPNLEIIQLTTSNLIWELGWLTEKRFPRLKKLCLNSTFAPGRGDFATPKYLQCSAIHSGIKEIVCLSDRQFEFYAAALLTVFPNVESLKIGRRWRWYDYQWPSILEKSFPSVKKLSVGWDSLVKPSRHCSWPGPHKISSAEVGPPILQILLNLMPNVEKLEVAEVKNLQEIATAIEETENLKELGLTIGENCNMQDLVIFPKNLRLTILK